MISFKNAISYGSNAHNDLSRITTDGFTGYGYGGAISGDGSSGTVTEDGSAA